MPMTSTGSKPMVRAKLRSMSTPELTGLSAALQIMSVSADESYVLELCNEELRSRYEWLIEELTEALRAERS